MTQTIRAGDLGFEGVNFCCAGFNFGDDLMLLGDLEDKQVGDLLDVVAVTDPRVFEDVGVVLYFGDDGG